MLLFFAGLFVGGALACCGFVALAWRDPYRNRLTPAEEQAAARWVAEYEANAEWERLELE